MDQVSQGFIKKSVTFFLSVAIVVSLLGAFYDLSSTLRNGGVDLRNRVVGARLLIRGIDPYYYRWKQGDPEIFIDPKDKLELPVSRVTIPPTGLILYTPFANLPYFYQRLLWFFLQWFAFVLSLLLLSRHSFKLKNQFLIGFGLFFGGASIFWRIHVGTGQIYIFYVLLIAASYWVSQQKNKFSDEFAGMLMGIAASMRFPLIIFILPMLIFKKTRLLIATLAGVCLSILSSILLFGSQVWFSYFSAAKIISQLSHGTLKIAPNPDNPVLPNIIEGVFFIGLPTSESGIIRNAHGKLPGGNSSFPLLIDRVFDLHIPSGYLIAGLMLLLLAYSFSIYYLQSRSAFKSQIPVLDAVFIFGSLMVLIAEFLMPVPRYSYSDVQFLVPILLILKNANFEKNITGYLTAILCLSLLILGGLFPWIPKKVILGEFLVLATLILMSLVSLGRSPSSKVDGA